MSAPCKVRADFHLHSCLSACASLELSPTTLVRRALAAGLDAVALTDHNCALHTPLFLRLCRQAGLHALAGIEVTCAEELHVLCLFDTPEPALELGARVVETIPRIPCRPHRFGDQVLVNEQEEIEAFLPWYLGNPTALTLTEVADWTHRHGGLVIPSHIDRPAHSLGSQLGRIPEYPFNALEIWNPKAPYLSGMENYPLVCFSDTHRSENPGNRWTLLELEEFSAAAIAAALRTGAFRTHPPLPSRLSPGFEM